MIQTEQGGPGRIAKVFIQIVAGLVVTALMIGLVEFASGFFVTRASKQFHLDPLSTTEGDAVSDTLAWMEINPVQMVKSLDLLWRLPPSTTRTTRVNPGRFGRNDTWTIIVNSEGLRGPEREYRGQRDGVYRILCVGDSVTFGFNADQNDSYPRQLERLLRAEYPDLRFEVVNAAVPGWSWVQGLRYLELEGIAMHPNLTIVGHGTNDRFFKAKITDSERIGILRSPLVRAMQRVSDVLDGTNTYRLVRQLSGRPLQDRVNSRGCDQQLRESKVCYRVSLPEIEASITEIHRLAVASNVDLLMLNLDFMGSDAVRASRKATEREGIRFTDLVPYFSELQLADEAQRVQQLGLQTAGPMSSAAEVNAHPVERRVVFRVLVPRAGGRVAVTAKSYLQEGFSLDEPMYDDGSHGDERAGDGVYSVEVRTPRLFGLRYKFILDGTAEFEPLPPLPSHYGDRIVRLTEDTIMPVDTFADMYLMAERTHPDVHGHEVITRRVREELGKLPSFAAFVGGTPSSTTADAAQR